MRLTRRTLLAALAAALAPLRLSARAVPPKPLLDIAVAGTPYHGLARARGLVAGARLVLRRERGGGTVNCLEHRNSLAWERRARVDPETSTGRASI